MSQDSSGRVPIRRPRYGTATNLLEIIYGMTFEIWEERGIELIRHYYAPDVQMFALSGLSNGVEAIVEGTRATLAAFPDRQLHAENVVWSADPDGDYSSHRIISPMTNSGASPWGPATGRAARVRTVADCLLSEGRIIREWLIRDTLPLVEQLGLDPVAAARVQRSSTNDATRQWWAQELDRLARNPGSAVDHPDAPFALKALEAAWLTGHDTALAECYPHYALSHPTPLSWHSGRNEIAAHQRRQQQALRGTAVSIDHIASQPWGHQGRELAVRWSVAVEHHGDYQGLEATGRPAYLLGSSHWRLVEDRIATEWTVCDGMGILAQLV